MTRALAVAGLLLLAALPAAQRAVQPGVDLVQVDVVVVDRKGQPVTGLTQSDFVVKEDGAVVEVTTFDEFTPGESADPDTARSIVLLLDDIGVPATGNQTIRTIARAIVSSAAAKDEIAVVRLHDLADEPFGDRQTAEFRIAAYQAGAVPYTEVTPQESLERVATLIRQIGSGEQRRTIVVCVGASIVCNVAEPPKSSPRALWPMWVAAISAAARANVAVYAVVPGRATLRGGGVIEFTGGELFATSYDVGPAIDRILRDANHYYRIGYWPTGKVRELHDVDVKVTRKGVKVHARRKRGP